jgi:hypothetical protein
MGSSTIQWEQNCSMQTDEQMDRQTDEMKIIVAFCNFADVPKKDA